MGERAVQSPQRLQYGLGAVTVAVLGSAASFGTFVASQEVDGAEALLLVAALVLAPATLLGTIGCLARALVPGRILRAGHAWAWGLGLGLVVLAVPLLYPTPAVMCSWPLALVLGGCGIVMLGGAIHAARSDEA